MMLSIVAFCIIFCGTLTQGRTGNSRLYFSPNNKIPVWMPTPAPAPQSYPSERPTTPTTTTTTSATTTTTFPPQIGPQRLDCYNVDPSSLTISGLSAGGQMAVSLHYMFSSEVKGAGILAAGVYLCASNVKYGCLFRPTPQDATNSIPRVDDYNAKGKIDSLTNIQNSKVYIFHGINDDRVLQASGKNLLRQYQHYGADVFAEFGIPAGHGQPVDGNGYGGPCSTTNPSFDYFNECGYNGAYEMFRWLYGPSIVKPNGSYVADGPLIEFDQTEFIADPSIAAMGEVGNIYVPNGCMNKSTECKVHVALQGCNSNKAALGDKYPRRSQYMEVAELNNIIVIFPQTANTPIEPNGCWDVYGYTNTDYETKWGIQPNILRRMWRRVIHGEGYCVERTTG